MTKKCVLSHALHTEIHITLTIYIHYRSIYVKILGLVISNVCAITQGHLLYKMGKFIRCPKKKMEEYFLAMIFIYPDLMNFFSLKLFLTLAVNPCLSAPCLNGGQCQNINNNAAFTCTCINGFTGDRCQNPRKSLF